MTEWPFPPALVLIPSFLVFSVIPFGSRFGGEKMVIADLNIGILFTFAVVYVANLDRGLPMIGIILVLLLF